MRYIFVIFILLAACTQVAEPEPFCTAPYIEWSPGRCCLDADSNGICDVDESQTVVEPLEPVMEEPEQMMESLLADIPDDYVFHNPETGIVIVVGDKRKVVMEAVTSGSTGIYWDTSQDRAWSVCDSDEELIQRGGLYSPETARCPVGAISVVPLSGSDLAVLKSRIKSPVDWMLEYRDKEPFDVDLTLQQLNVRSIRPVMQFRDDHTITTLRFDAYHGVPVRVERTDVNTRKKFLWDYKWYPDGVDRFRPTEAMVTIPKDAFLAKGYDLRITDAYPIGPESIRVRGALKNTGFSTMPAQDILVECFDDAGEVLGSAELTLPAVERYNTKTFQLELLADSSEFDYCIAQT